MKKIILYFATVAILTNLANAQTFDQVLASKLQNTLDSMQTANDLKGISASVLIPEQGIWSGGSGFSHDDVPINTDMLFGIGSNTKTFTAVLLLILQENVFLSLDDSIGKWISVNEFINPAITVRQLLNHTSGLYNYTDTTAYRDSILSDANRIWQPEELLQFVGPPLFPAGEGWSYCNTNYLLAGMIAKAATCEKVSTLFRRYIFGPLQMDSAFLSVEEELKGEIAHRWMGEVDLFNIPINSAFSGAWTAGAMFSTSKEMVQWYYALMNGQVINQASLAQMRTFVGPGNYGLGISQKILAGRTVWGHTGECRGYSSIAIYDTVLHVSISVLVNQLPASPVLVAQELLRIIANSPVVSIRNHSLTPPKEGYELFQNYPNPLNPQTVISYRLPVSSKVTLKIYDVLGQEVRTLVNENKPAGCHSVVWDGKNELGESVGSGIYFYKLKLGNNFKQIKKCLFVK